MPRSLLLALALVLPAALPCARRARADETAAPSAALQLVAELEAAKAAKDDGAWIAALGKVGEAYKGAADAEKKALLGAAAGGLKAKAEAVQVAALDALIASGDADAAWKAGVKGALPDAKTEEALTAELKALEAVKLLKPEGAVGALQGLVEKAKDPKVAAAAVSALGGYERSKQRVAILEHLVKALRTARPGTNSSGQRGTSPRWDAMAPLAVPALNELTGQKVADFDAWLTLHDENKKKLAALFTNPLD
jgi:hypothetical protein